MQSGIFWGYVGLVEGLVGRIMREFGAPMDVVSPPAGLAPLFDGATQVIDHVDPDLTLWGLRLIYRPKQQQMNHRPVQSGARPEYRDPNALYFVPLGGAGEIGMNLNVYGYQGDWLIIDCGVTFGDDSQPGLEVVMPDPAFIAERRDRLARDRRDARP